MKILHVVPYYPPERLGGVGEYAAALHESLVEAGHDSMVITAGCHSTERVRRIAPTGLGWIVKSLAWIRYAAGCDVVHFQAGEALPMMALLALWPKKARIVSTFHVSYRGVADAHRPYSLEGAGFAHEATPWRYRVLACPIHRVLDQLALKLSHGVNAICRSTALDLLGPERGASATVIYNGIAPLPPSEKATPVELFYAGAPGHRKRIHALPFLLRHVREALPQARLRIAGFDLAQEPALKKQFDEWGLLPAVECIGAVPAEELTPHYASAGVVVIPSAYEGLPMVILEAMRSGCPVVATRVSGHPEVIIDDENGYLVAPDHPEFMAARCLDILRDDVLRKRLSEAALRTFAEKFSLRETREQYLEFYARVLRDGRA
jgi:glycosyltransferase involved in cell wall biosynthesis